MESIVLIGEIASQMRVSIPTVRRYLQESRMGRGNFPLPISKKRAKLRWRASDIEAYLVSQSVAPPVASTVRQTKRDQKDFLQRQADAEKSLEKHRINRSK